ncbi:MAG: PEP_CTERM-anchored TLD domain-containing protein [Thermodesulfobacteriota bacterium]
MIRKISVLVVTLIVLLGFSHTSEAVVINGGSNLLSAPYATQLETWLGEGSIDLTNIFSHELGDGKTSADFHTSSDGMGRTFSVIEVLATKGNEHQIIGGYNPQSWNQLSDYNYTPNDADRTAFLFNLTNTFVQLQKLGVFEGLYQTYTSNSYGPSFGVGHDLFVNSSLSMGYAYEYTYGTGINVSNIIGGTFVWDGIDFGKIEVFTIGEAATVPEPSTYLLLGSGILGLAVWRRRRKG